MREYEMETTFDVPLQTFLRVVYGDDGQCLRQYHASCGNCADATVPAWDVSEDRSTELHGVVGSRTIAFSKPMELPSVVERLLGPSAGKRGAGGSRGSRLSFIERQSLEVEPVTGNVLVRSAASLDSAWVSPERADKFNAVVEVAYASTIVQNAYGPAEHTTMAARIRVNAAGAWALQPVVERVMEHRAVAGFREWVVWIDEFVEKTSIGASGFAAELPRLRALGLGSLSDDDDDSMRRAAFEADLVTNGEDAAGRNGKSTSAGTTSSPAEKTKRKKYPATPGASRRASLSVEDDPDPLRAGPGPGSGPVVETPPRDEPAPCSADATFSRHVFEKPAASPDASADADDSSADSDASDDAAFDDAASGRSGASFRSAASFVSARSARSSRSSDGSKQTLFANDQAPTVEGPSDRRGAGSSRAKGSHRKPSVSPSDRSEGRDADVPEREDADVDAGVTGTREGPSPRTPPSAARDGAASPSSGSAARLDAAYRDGWFMRTVMNDLTALKTGAGEQQKVVAALEERTRALAAELARTKAELRRGGARGASGVRYSEHRGDTSDPVRLVRWTAALSLAAGAGYVLAAAARERRQ